MFLALIEYQIIHAGSGRCILPKEPEKRFLHGGRLHAYYSFEFGKIHCCDALKFSNIGGILIDVVDAYCLDISPTMEYPVLGLGKLFFCIFVTSPSKALYIQIDFRTINKSTQH